MAFFDVRIANVPILGGWDFADDVTRRIFLEGRTGDILLDRWLGSDNRRMGLGYLMRVMFRY